MKQCGGARQRPIPASHYFRKPGHKPVPLPGIPGSAEFMRGKMMNVHEVDRAGNIVARLCFAPKGDLPMGDILLAQKIALETMERDALKMARRNHILVADAQLH
jgi:hypothetical protein